jgi:hypothetical protein
MGTKPPRAEDHSQDVSSQHVIDHFCQAIATFLEIRLPDRCNQCRIKRFWRQRGIPRGAAAQKEKPRTLARRRAAPGDLPAVTFCQFARATSKARECPL